MDWDESEVEDDDVDLGGLEFEDEVKSFRGNFAKDEVDLDSELDSDPFQSKETYFFFGGGR